MSCGESAPRSSHQRRNSESDEFELEKEARCFPNPYLNNSIIPELLEARLKKSVEDFVRLITEKTSTDTIHRHFSPYVGPAGIGFMFFRLYENASTEGERSRYLESAKQYVLNALQSVESSGDTDKPTFIEGVGGVFAQCAVLYHLSNDADRSQKFVDKTTQLLPKVLDDSFSSNEVLYGRAGYLWALIFMRKYLKQKQLDESIEKVVRKIIDEGRKLSDSHFPLMYQWHKTKYYGAAHGVSGILFVLMLTPHLLSESDRKLITGTIDKLIGLKLPRGNFPSSANSSSDRLVHWCHGAPAFALLFCKAYEVFGDVRYLKEAASACEVIRERGLLRKGLGLCHGISGNAYPFLYLYHHAKDEKYLLWAQQFCDFMMKETNALLMEPDHPYSLFEGIGGAVCLYSDVLRAKEKKPCFPAFDL